MITLEPFTYYSWNHKSSVEILKKNTDTIYLVDEEKKLKSIVEYKTFYFYLLKYIIPLKLFKMPFAFVSWVIMFLLDYLHLDNENDYSYSNH